MNNSIEKSSVWYRIVSYPDRNKNPLSVRFRCCYCCRFGVGNPLVCPPRRSRCRRLLRWYFRRGRLCRRFRCCCYYSQ